MNNTDVYQQVYEYLLDKQSTQKTYQTLAIVLLKELGLEKATYSQLAEDNKDYISRPHFYHIKKAHKEFISKVVADYEKD